MYVFGSGRRRWRGGDWLRELGLGFTNPVGTYGVLDMCLCCGGVGGVCGERVGLGPGSGGMGWLLLLFATTRSVVKSVKVSVVEVDKHTN